MGYIWFAEGLLGATNKIRRVKNVLSGSTPAIDTTGSATVAHSGHSTVVVDDMVFRNAAGSNEVYIVGKDATDQWVQRFDATAASPSFTAQTLSGSANGYEHKLLATSDGNIYISHANLIDSYSTGYVYSANVLDLPAGWGVTALAEWNSRMVLAVSFDDPFTFTQRTQGSRSGIFLWNFTSASFEKDPVICPTRYISAVVNEPDGNLLVFGGVNEGKCTLFQFTGYGFAPLYTYIGDLPRSRHSVDFDSEGRVLWITADGQICRFDKRTSHFDHLGTITTGSSAGGMLCRMLNTAGFEFVAASGTGSTYTAKRISLGQYIGDGAAVSDDVTTPLAITGLTPLPARSMIEYIDVSLQKNLASGDKIEVRLYKDGSSSPTTLGSLSFTVDGAVAGKRIYCRKYGVDSCSIGFAWKMSDATNVAPGITAGSIETKPLR